MAIHTDIGSIPLVAIEGNKMTVAGLEDNYRLTVKKELSFMDKARDSLSSLIGSKWKEIVVFNSDTRTTDRVYINITDLKKTLTKFLHDQGEGREIIERTKDKVSKLGIKEDDDPMAYENSEKLIGIFSSVFPAKNKLWRSHPIL